MKRISDLLLNDTFFICLGIATLVGYVSFLAWGAYKSDQRYYAQDETSNEYLRARTFVYDRHRYILFERHNVVGNTYIVHDPDCSCNETASDKELYVGPERFDYNGHRYILFRKKNGFDASSVVHDPDCP